jgi:hypothetical protein
MGFPLLLGGLAARAATQSAAVAAAAKAVSKSWSTSRGISQGLKAGVGKPGYKIGEVSNTIVNNTGRDGITQAARAQLNRPEMQGYLRDNILKPSSPASLWDKASKQAAWRGDTSAKSLMENFNEVRKSDLLNQTVRKENFIREHAHGLAKMEQTALNAEAKAATKAAIDGALSSPQGVGAAATLAAGAVGALANELLNPDDTVISNNDPNCPGCRDKRPDKNRKRNKDYPPDKDDDDENEEEEDEKEEDLDETDDGGDSCSDEIDGEAQNSSQNGGAQLWPVIG